ncbi:hypothetical protein [Thalassotalea crassostreae]|uniref:hypothetical protein n=1 Tax=Thalassotalea crassostreae TaxID=1763536 RepID=UPI00083814BC|nr:hypothetical protein [Thalassotalea crassostreae]
MKNHIVKSITIVDGSSSRWVSALYLIKLYSHASIQIQTSVIESKYIIDRIKHKLNETVKAVAFFNQLDQHSKSLVTQLPEHRALIEKVKKYGLSKV